MKLSYCVMQRQGKNDEENGVILLQGLLHADHDQTYKTLQELEKKCTNRGYLVFREGISNSQMPEETETIEVYTILGWMIDSVGDHTMLADLTGKVAEVHALPAGSNHIKADVDWLDYARRLAKEGFLPDYRVIKFIL